ncbi:ATPase [Variovorax paradoxus]|uniref:AAA family ATPase n=1 Tax=Comamonadaceae TaxID=80864 RepID=UPI00056EB922|nr:ATP-binding protein [Xenophilus azovorans]KPU99615.1 ATPase [Variovorax paradoxus]MBN8748633.1 AAA family ATPase [Variovorax sp.]KPV01967.1 ATPase [Variovorax paradoxus]KPV02773.1 ATPase [Variovorax paradoxus]KPV17780.1 ATPase [Variovorax paradoxus]
MATGDQLKALVRSHAQGDDRHFYSVAMQMAAREAKQGHGKLAEELRELIDAAKERQVTPGGGAIPIARPRGELAGLLTASYPTRKLTDMVLAQPVEESLQRVLKEQRHLSKLRSHGLHPRRKLLLVGPSGTGKTMTASALAGELGIPLFVVRLDALITKFMGETAAKLRQVFDAASSTRGVYFFDEFDAIGSHRGTANDVGEIRRILNSFLLMIEQDESNSLIVAATNHPGILDDALFRRFDDVIEYHVPNPKEIQALLRMRLAPYLKSSKSIRELAAAADGLSHAEIARAMNDAIKETVMHDLDEVSPDMLGALLLSRQNVRQRSAAAPVK